MLNAIGIDFGGTTIKSGLVQEGRILRHGKIIDTQEFANPEAIVDALVDVIMELRAGDPGAAAVGIGLPGLVDSINGVVHELTNVPGWHDVDLRRLLRDRTGLPVTIENDANAMAYGEFRYGAAREARHVVCITLGTGVGGALILDGRLYRGAQLGAGEIGHVSIDYRGKAGPYGNYGGLEEYVGNQQISERAFAACEAAGQKRSAEECTPAALARWAADGDSIALKLWEEIGTEIGAALANVIWVVNPDAIVIGGGVAKAGEVLFGPIHRAVEARTARVFHEHLRILPAALGNEAGIIGSAILALEYAQAERSRNL
jgi:glucokinase